MGGHRLVTFAACTSLIIKSAAGGTVHGDVALHSGPTMGQEITWHWWERCGCWFLCAQPRFGIISFCMNVAHIHFWQKKKKRQALPFNSVFRAPKSSSLWEVPCITPSKCPREDHQRRHIRSYRQGAMFPPLSLPFEFFVLASLVTGLVAGSGKRITSPITFSFEEFPSVLKDVTFR